MSKENPYGRLLATFEENTLYHPNSRDIAGLMRFEIQQEEIRANPDSEKLKRWKDYLFDPSLDGYIQFLQEMIDQYNPQNVNSDQKPLYTRISHILDSFILDLSTQFDD